uniref:Nuclear factor 7, brain-like n=1 Tax=Neogobius melanostomus TaxID=47308 RepID=A0A8C6WK48_9GOBI
MQMATVSECDLSCSVCQDVFSDPVLLSCSHSFCRECLKTWWAQKPLKPCPLCNRRSSREDPPLNLALMNLCLDYKQSSREAVCNEHSEKLKVYCFNDQRPVCLVCRDSEAHRNHTFKPIAEVAPALRDGLSKTLQRLDEQLQVKLQFSAAVTHIEAQAQLTERQIQDEFEKLHQFLVEEKQGRIRALREEEEQKRKSLEEKMAAVSREIEALSQTIAATAEQLGAADLSFLLQYKAAVERVQRCPLVEGPQLGPGALIDQAKHLGNLGFNIWNNMKDLVQFYPVVLDPNTAHPDLTLTENLSGVKSGERQKCPENPERFQWDYVLGSEGFSSGTHSWDVEVCGDDYWSVGVVNESVQRKGPMNAGVWEIFLRDGKYHVISRPKREKTLSLKRSLRRVRVKLDLDEGTLSFSDADTKTHLHTFTRSFSERLFPSLRSNANLHTQILLHPVLACAKLNKD